jgi:hypothetical protein
MIPTTSRRLAADIERYENNAAARIARKQERKPMEAQPKFTVGDVVRVNPAVHSEYTGYQGRVIAVAGLPGDYRYGVKLDSGTLTLRETSLLLANESDVQS